MKLQIIHTHREHPATQRKLDHLIKLVGGFVVTELERLAAGVAQLKTDAAENKAAAAQAARDLDDLKAKADAIKAKLDEITAGGVIEPGVLAALAAEVEGVSAGLDATSATLTEASQRNDPPAGTIVLPPGVVGQSYAAPISLPGVKFSVTGGALPDGLSIGTRELIGVPERAGDFSFTAHGQDAQGNALGDPQAFTITIS